MNNIIVKELNITSDQVINFNIIDGSFKYIINVSDGVNLTINRTGMVNKYLENVVINVSNNTTLIINDGILVKEDFNSAINTIINGNNNTIKLNGGYVSKANGNIEIISNGSVLKDTYNNDFYEHADLLVTNNGKVKVLPNLLVGTNETISNHGVTISGYDAAMLTYLKTKGISLEEAKNLIEQSYLNKFTK